MVFAQMLGHFVCPTGSPGTVEAKFCPHCCVVQTVEKGKLDGDFFPESSGKGRNWFKNCCVTYAALSSLNIHSTLNPCQLMVKKKGQPTRGHWLELVKRDAKSLPGAVVVVRSRPSKYERDDSSFNHLIIINHN